MKRRSLIGYQLLTGLSDGVTGALLIVSPSVTLRLMGIHVAAAALPFLSFIGAFVLSVGLACLYGACLAPNPRAAAKLQVVWLVTAITRGLVAIFVAASIFSGTLEAGWITVAISDAAFAFVQAIGLSKGWLSDGPA